MKLKILVGPPGSGKSTYAQSMVEFDYVRISQDAQGKTGHMDLFENCLKRRSNIIVDRMGFSKEQRNRYIKPAKDLGYEVEIMVLHESYETCLDRVIKRIGNHETIVDEKGARSALQTFFTKYERPAANEADKITFVYPIGPKPKAIICDLDGTLCNVEHRRHFVRPKDGQKKNWPAFFAGIPNDSVNKWCADILEGLSNRYSIVYCSGRGDNERKATTQWLESNKLDSFFGSKYNESTIPLFMRNRVDSREDYIVKEMILDFELLTRYEPLFMIDDRSQVVNMWRRRGFTCLQCDEGNF